MEICGDNRFEIIAKAKEHLLDATNIDTSEDEMKVLDNFLYRCWQMGWLDRYAEQTEPSDSEKSNNCEPQVVDWCKRKPCTLELFDDDGNYIEPKDEPQTDNSIGCSKCESRYECYDRDMPHAVHCNNYGKEPQTDCAWK